MPEKKPIGKITHYFDKISVAIIKFNKKVSVGEMVKFKGANTDFSQKIASMQFDHKDISSAKKGQEVGIKIKEKIHGSDKIYEIK